MAVAEIVVPACPEAIDWIYTLLGSHGSATTVVVAECVPVPSQDPAEPWPLRVRLRLSGPAANLTTAQLRQILRSLWWTDLIGEIEAAVDPPNLTNDEPQAPQICYLGKHFVVVRPGATMASPPGRASIILEPTLSFGSGLHPTTRLTMELIERHVGPDTRVLDLGSGSGILSIALAKLGAHVTALDNDPVAVEATRRNVRINGVKQLVRVGHGSLGQGARLGYWIGGVELGPVMEVDIGQGYAVIVANILARVHIALAHDYRRALREDDQQSSLLIVAGFTTDQEDEVLAALRSAQLEPIERRQAEEMVALALGLVRS